MTIELRTRLYILALAVAAVTLSITAALVWPMGPASPSPWLLVLITLLIALAGRFSILLSRQAEASLFTVPLYMAVLLAHPTEAALIGAAGTLMFQLMLKRPARAVLFNVSMAATAGGLGGIVFFSLKPEGASLALTQGHMIAAGLAGLVLHLHNILPVVGMVTLRKGNRFWLFWADSYVLEAVVEGMLLSLGLLAALLAVQASWGLVFMVVPSLAAYVVLKRTVEYAAQKGIVAEELAHRLYRELESLHTQDWQAPGPASPAVPPVLSSGRSWLRSVLR